MLSDETESTRRQRLGGFQSKIKANGNANWLGQFRKPTERPPGMTGKDDLLVAMRKY